MIELNNFNLISNSCCGGWCYKIAHKQYNNPFMWSLIRCDDMISLINQYESLVWNNIMLYEDEMNKSNRTFNIVINDLITIHYVHFKWELNKEFPDIRRAGRDLFANNMYEYVVDKYKSRVNRMLSERIKPTFFILGANQFLFDYTLENLEKLIKTTNSGAKRYIITQYTELKMYENDMLQIRCVDTPISEGNYTTQYYSNTFFDDVLNFMSDGVSP